MLKPRPDPAAPQQVRRREEGTGVGCNHRRGAEKEAPWQIEATSLSGWPILKPSATERAQILP